ncbi:TetR family transcriptional regulator C-terminal domain-containing protein [Neorhizobium sp. JUb45]|uniref:TetR family transcriptional regulator C-terminal domain-containing protein n=1 Tax=unclassified Neorhizobium TaxID=2629175 RepID=UPI00104F20C3|nr:TetR family transcriptional regulator C-terminal domain-containing protein [Neorhizobium sp. JUb45]
MSRRTFHRASETERREDLIAATLDCIAEFGIQGATVRQIAARAGVTGGLIRHYFDSKDQMMQAAYREMMAAMTSGSIEAANSAGTAKQRLGRFIDANHSASVTDPRMLSLWAAFIGHIRHDPTFAAIHRENYTAILTALENLLRDFFIENNRPEEVARCHHHTVALTGLLDGLWLEATLADDLFAEGELQALAFRSVETLLGLKSGDLSVQTDDTQGADGIPPADPLKKDI